MLSSRTALLSIGALAAACAVPGSQWKVRRAEQLHAGGRKASSVALVRSQ